MSLVTLEKKFQFLDEFVKKYETQLCDFLFSQINSIDVTLGIYDTLELYLDVDTPIDRQIEIVSEFLSLLDLHSITYRKFILDVSN